MSNQHGVSLSSSPWLVQCKQCTRFQPFSGCWKVIYPRHSTPEGVSEEALLYKAQRPIPSSMEYLHGCLQPQLKSRHHQTHQTSRAKVLGEVAFITATGTQQTWTKWMPENSLAC